MRSHRDHRARGVRTLLLDRRGLRLGAALFTIAALLLPGVFALTGAQPDWILGIEAAELNHHGAAANHREHGAADSEEIYSNIPGSPDHPAGHNCNPCQVLKYVASYLPQLPFFLPAGTPGPFLSVEEGVAQREGHIASLPPSRAPPQPPV